MSDISLYEYDKIIDELSEMPSNEATDVDLIPEQSNIPDFDEGDDDDLDR